MPEGAIFHNPYILTDLQPTARAAAALPAAGAWDAAPTEFYVSGMDYILLELSYTRAAAGGAFEWRIETSGDSSGANWERGAIYQGGAVAAGADTTSAAQRENIGYGSTGAGAETFTIGPIALNGTIERFRIPARETGVVGNPGTLQIRTRLM